MPDPNAPKPPEASKSPGDGSTEVPGASPPTEAPSSKPIVTPTVPASSHPPSEDGSENDDAADPESVNEDEVGVAEGTDDDFGPEVRNVSVTCHKCGQKSPTSVTRKQLGRQVRSARWPEFQTKCNFCNYVSTYVLTEDGTSTIA